VKSLWRRKKKSAAVAQSLTDLALIARLLSDPQVAPMGMSTAEFSRSSLLSELPDSLREVDLDAISHAASLLFGGLSDRSLLPAEQAAHSSRAATKYVEGSNEVVVAGITFSRVRQLVGLITATAFFNGRSPSFAGTAQAQQGLATEPSFPAAAPTPAFEAKDAAATNAVPPAESPDLSADAALAQELASYDEAAQTAAEQLAATEEQ